MAGALFLLEPSVSGHLKLPAQWVQLSTTLDSSSNIFQLNVEVIASASATWNCQPRQRDRITKCDNGS
jgi:hypothetical protein